MQPECDFEMTNQGNTNRLNVLDFYSHKLQLSRFLGLFHANQTSVPSSICPSPDLVPEACRLRLPVALKGPQSAYGSRYLVPDTTGSGPVSGTIPSGQLRYGRSDYPARRAVPCLSMALKIVTSLCIQASRNFARRPMS
jgi:hypothetical protein